MQALTNKTQNKTIEQKRTILYIIFHEIKRTLAHSQLIFELESVNCAMISITNLSFYFGSRALYDGASLHIKPKDRIGLIGANGTGKSTLLRMINNEYQPDAGTISKAGGCTIGFLNQDLLSYLTDEPILNVAMQAF